MDISLLCHLPLPLQLAAALGLLFSLLLMIPAAAFTCTVCTYLILASAIPFTTCLALPPYINVYDGQKF